MEIRNLLEGSARIDHVKAGGVVVYSIEDVNLHHYLIEIDTNNPDEMGETEYLIPVYPKAAKFEKWIRRAMENNELVQTD